VVHAGGHRRRNHIIIKLNGKTTVDFVDEKNRHSKGHFAFQQHNDGSVITIRKAEVIELPVEIRISDLLLLRR